MSKVRSECKLAEQIVCQVLAEIAVRRSLPVEITTASTGEGVVAHVSLGESAGPDDVERFGGAFIFEIGMDAGPALVQRITGLLPCVRVERLSVLTCGDCGEPNPDGSDLTVEVTLGGLVQVPPRLR